MGEIGRRRPRHVVTTTGRVSLGLSSAEKVAGRGGNTPSEGVGSEGVFDTMEVPNPSSPHHPPYFPAFQLAAPPPVASHIGVPTLHTAFVLNPAC